MTLNDFTSIRVEVTNPETPFGGVLVFPGSETPRSTDIPVGVLEFIELLDTPKSYAGHAGKMVVVKADESGLEFVDVPSGGGGDLPSTGGSRITVTGDARVTTLGDTRVTISVFTMRTTSFDDTRITTGSDIRITD
jgi:hypothetical protein